MKKTKYYIKKTENINLLKPTAQVSLLVSIFMQDFNVHTRQEIRDYVFECCNDLGLPEPRPGVFEGGLRSALKKLDCETISAGTYVMKNNDSYNKTPTNQTIELCQDSIEKLSEISRKINYVEASEEEILLLVNLKKFSDNLKEWKKVFENL